MKNKGFISVVIVLVLLLAQFSVLIGSVNAETTTGNDGDLSWSVDDETGTLTFSGSGKLTKNWKNSINEQEVKKVVIQNGIDAIGYNAFYNCTNLTSIEIPSSVTSIKAWAFENCTSLASIEISSSVTTIDALAFENCTSLTSIEVADNNEQYCSANGILFNKNKDTIIVYPAGKQGNYQIPDYVTTIGRYAFGYCKHLTSIEIPSSVTSIGGLAFSSCGSLTNIEIPNSVITIGFQAFCNCENLTSIEIPNSVTTIGDHAIYICPNLTIYCKSNSTAYQYAQENNIPFVLDDTAPTISKLSQDGSYIKVEAVDNDGGCGLALKPYSLDSENWQSSNKISVTEDGTYTVYVKDKLGNIVSGTINVTIPKTDSADDKNENDKGSEDSKKESDKETNSNDAEKKSEDSNKNEKSKEDETKSDKVIPQAGATFSISLLAVLAIIGLVNYKKSKKYNY